MGTRNVLKRMDLYRDGGSISAQYTCDEIDTVLFFRIDFNPFMSLSQRRCRKFLGAYLRESHTFNWVNNVGVTMDDVLKSELQVSCATARSILTELAPQINAFNSLDEDLFDEMMLVSLSEGTGRSHQFR